MSQNTDKVLDHDVDGIKEYDNPMPGWLVAVLLGSVVFSVLYVAFYALAFAPASMTSEYLDEQVAERAAVQSYFDANPIAPPSAESLLRGATVPDTLEMGRTRFQKTCASCHGEAAQGLIGPNLTDDRWLHGGRVVDVFTVIAKGVPAKGMPPWGRAMKPEELSALASYVRSLSGTNPANAKPPEGDPALPEPLPQ
jgi:cytochrome c oxidase cbb3-type subunit 3